MHVFKFDREWGEKLSADAPKRGQPRGTYVEENKKLVTDRGVKLGSGVDVNVPEPPPTQRFVPPPNATQSNVKFPETRVTVSLIDTLSAALALGDDSAALNFANADFHGGGYYHGARAQEEDLCRLLPQLIHSLEYVQYPIKQEEGECLVTRGLVAVRKVFDYAICPSQGQINMLTAAMPCGDCGSPGSREWNATVNLRIRGVLWAARQAGFAKLVLGAWGCGAFGNPPDLVARLFREQLGSPEFRGSFSDIVFAIIDPRGDGNFQPFLYEISQMHEESSLHAVPEKSSASAGGYGQAAGTGTSAAEQRGPPVAE